MLYFGDKITSSQFLFFFSCLDYRSLDGEEEEKDYQDIEDDLNLKFSAVSSLIKKGVFIII